jgi:hypothetical protein
VRYDRRVSLKRWRKETTLSEKILLLTGLVPFVIAGVLVFNSIDFDDLFDEELPYSLCPSSRTATEITSPSEMSENAEAYTGPGPHHILVHPIGDPRSDLGSASAQRDLPRDWLPPRDSETGAHRLDRLELVACQYQYVVGSIGTCGYRTIPGDRPVSVTIWDATYDFRVYEAATGRLVASFTVDGAEGACSEGPSIYRGETKTVVGPDPAKLIPQLEPLVEHNLPVRR